MSVFRSAVDIWAISQLFPIVPLQRLDEEPTHEATLADLTNDSDGKVSRFVGPNGVPTPTLPVHELREGEPSYPGLFLGGVYQEGMGSAHNLFGHVNVVSVRSKPNGSGGYGIDRVVKGQNIGDVLESVHHDSEGLIEAVTSLAQKAGDAGKLTPAQAGALVATYAENLRS
eukprot:TRINITY_DN6447_c0_g1_i1.p2 TRINITY_DN6447_c0_g1~~TRINITY_DN6447_c0_g1_i1.p2  ORF type:complete len:171 (+),score=19.92 TRINITY_DN6447_c0_g1_i1:328-840(+)